MDFLKGQLDKIQQQLGGLNASQKMLTGSLVAIMVMTLLWWGRYAGMSEMEPVLPQSFSATDVARVHAHFKMVGIPSKVDGDRVLVPTDRRDEAIASLAFADILPENSASGFDEISKHMNSFMPQSMTDAWMNEGKQKTLQHIIRKSFPGVKEATVLLTPPGPPKLRMSNEATASVAITMHDKGPGSHKIAQAAAALVAGAQQNLTVKNVSVVIGGRPYRLKNPEEGIGDSGEFGEARAKSELYFEDKIRRLYPDVEGLFVNISVAINTTTLQKQTTVNDNVQQKETRSNTRNETEPVLGNSAAEPGAMSNTGASIDPVPVAGAGGEKTLDESDTEFQILADTTTENSSKPAGDFTAVSAALRVPRSYFVKMFKTISASSAEPAQEALQPLMDAEIERMRSLVVSSTAIENDVKVFVSMYDDSPSPLLAAATAAPPSAMTTTIGAYGKEIAIGALALISLFMVSMMVRKGSPTPMLAGAAGALLSRETPDFSNMAEVAGIVGDTGQMLDGMELDEDAVRTQQMLAQVENMVGENPDAAANLVKRWLNRT